MRWWRWWTTKARAQRTMRRALRLQQQERWSEALQCLRIVERLDPTQPGVFEALIAVHQRCAPAEWTAADCADSLRWEMQRQALANPEVAVQYERLAPEWQQVIDLANAWLVATPDQQEALLERLRGYGSGAILPLLDLLRQRVASPV